MCVCVCVCGVCVVCVGVGMCVCGVCVCVVCVCVKRQLVDVTREELVHNSSTGTFPSFLVSLPKQHTECSTASLWVVIFSLHGYFYSGKKAVTVLIRRYCILIMMGTMLMGTLLMGTYVSLPSLL